MKLRKVHEDMAAIEGIPPLDELEELGEPYEILDMDPGESTTMTIVNYRLGKGFIKPERAPEGVTVPILRILVPPEEQPRTVPWWDTTSKTLIAQLLPQLDAWKEVRQSVKITKHGRAPSARFSVEKVPPE